MSDKRNNGILGIFVVFLAFVLSGCQLFSSSEETTQDRVQREGTVIVGFANEQPYAYQNREGELTGSSVEIARITHEMDFAREIADRIAFFDNGKIVEDGPPEQILFHPKSQRLKDFLERFMSTQAALE